MMIKYLSLSEKNIIALKEKLRMNLILNNNKLLKCLSIKFFIYFLLCNILLILFWYYLSCFCIVFINTQWYLIKNILFSFWVSLLYPFITNFIPGIFRISALRTSKKDKTCLYKTSKIMQMLL